MSPRRKFQAGEGPLLAAGTVVSQRRWGLAFVATVTALVMTAATMASILMSISHASREHAMTKDQQVLSYVKWFMAEFTTLDPYHANDYVSRILAQATGDFAKQYHDKANEILFQVARAEPTTGTVLDVGMERWNDDGSANVLIVTEVTSKSPDEKQVVENTNRWVATATREGDQWKISNLLQVT
ncbi:mammalian cell entry protein [Mycobacterium uberis]|uniref:Mammalian cell entry protein n=1 Tax=Mycobacterium uberis TaxID=2162698 RepID=A0A3E1HIV8_9MYCO|nr:mammalian cell entry protein [Mycobacterium uberis]RFD26382.1 mammalian cell entry protein [Mycobacterium uberis]